MQEMTVRRFSLWAAWNYEKEEIWLNQLSSQGLHLVSSLFLAASLNFDPSVRYVYRIDYQPDMTGRKLAEYISFYADQGWDYVCAYGGGWHYFRQPYAEGQTQELYTDRTSLAEHYKRIQRLILIVFCMNLAIGLPNLAHVFGRTGLTWVWLVNITVTGVLGYGVLRMTRMVRELEQQK